MSQYTIETCKSKADSLSAATTWQDEINQFNDALAVVWYYDSIVFYSIKNREWNTALKSFDEIVRLRIFNRDKELHIWRSNGVLKGRMRDDTQGSKVDYVDANQIMNGTNFGIEGGQIIATEEKGIKYKIPLVVELEGIKADAKDRITLVTRNYIEYSDDIQQAGYTDSRFIGFSIVKIK